MRRRISSFLATGLIGLAACQDSGPTNPAQAKFDPAAVSANLAIIDRVNSAPVLKSFRALGDQAIAGGVTAVSVRDIQAKIASGHGIGVMRDVAARLAGLVASTTAGPALVPIIRTDVLGKTFVYDAAAKKYVIDPARTGAPPNGVRFILYEIDDATQQPNVGKEIGYSDLIDQKVSSPSSLGLRLVVISHGETYLDYRFGISGGIERAAITVAGFMGDGTDRVNFNLTLSGQLVGRNGAVTLEASLEIPAHNFTATAKVQGVAGVENGDGQIDLALHLGADLVTLTSRVNGNRLDATVKMNGKTFATATGDPKSPVIKGDGGRDLTAEELGALGQIVGFAGQLFGIFGGLLAPVGGLILVGFGL
ncbi:MAG: hypothetical protein ABI647_00475 [Gemmatimonadota bacterium]